GANGSVDHADKQWISNDDDIINSSNKRQWISASTTLDKSHDEQENGGDVAVFEDPRLPEEIASDPYEDGTAAPVYRMPVLRKSNSKIPILAASRIPVPQGHDSSSQRSRNNTVNSGDDLASTTTGPSSSPAKSRRPSESASR